MGFTQVEIKLQTRESSLRFGLIHIHYQFNKLTFIFCTSVLLLMINCIITLLKWLWNHEPQASGLAANFDNVIINLSSIRGQTYKKKLMSICFFTITRPETGQKLHIILHKLKFDLSVLSVHQKLISYCKKLNFKYFLSFFQVLLVASSFMSPAESKSFTNVNRVRMFGKQ